LRRNDPLTTKVTIKPFTRIEGTMQITINLDETGNVHFAHVNVQEFRGFERFLRGRHISKVSSITTRICGVCPVPHHLASLKAIENGLGVEPPKTAQMLRELMLVCEHVSDHMLHMFVLAGPDILLSELEPEERGLPSLYAQYPDVVREVLRIRNVTQSLISALGVQAVHPETGVLGGITVSLSESQRRHFLTGIRLAKNAILKFHDDIWLPQVKKAAEQYAGLGGLETHFMGLVKDDHLQLYDGVVRVVRPGPEVLYEFVPSDYLKYIGERTFDYSYAKAAYLQSPSPTGDICRTGPIGRVNVAKFASTQHANAYMEEFKSMFGEVAQETLALNLARYICTVYAIERAEQLLENERITGTETIAPLEYVAGEGVGIVEAPRGLLIHHYRWDDDGYVTMANIITPTNANCYAIDSSLKKVAERSITAGKVDKTQLENEIGLVIRAYDPCLSCATHILSNRPLVSIEIVDSEGHKRTL
jgi:coenzyme F420-reducing hydrogenase alpha subunit